MTRIFDNYLAPIDEYTDLPFRLLTQKYGADATCIPLINSTAIVQNPKTIFYRVDANKDERNLGVQLVGETPKDMGKATQIIIDRFPFVKWLNINAGCPSAKTVGCGGGSALLNTPERICRIIQAMKKMVETVPISVKIRIVKDKSKTIEIARTIERAGADFIIVHGRTPTQGYSGIADWNRIKSIKNAIDIPVVGNGDIKELNEGRQRVKNGFCDSFMIGRAAMTNPMLFSNRIPNTQSERMDLLREYLELYRRYLGEPNIKDVKLKAMNFISGIHYAAQKRNSIARSNSIEEIESIMHNELEQIG